MLQNAELHQFVVFQYAWDGDYLDPLTFLSLMESQSHFNYGGYSNPEYDALIEAAKRESDKEKRYALFRQAEELLDKEVVFIPLFYYATKHLIKPYVRGWELNAIDRNPSKYMYILEHRET
jgi:oligopeptide transport system substrate-binding protein